MQIPGEKCCTILASAFSKRVKIKLDSGEKIYNVICPSLPFLITDMLNTPFPTVLQEQIKEGIIEQSRDFTPESMQLSKHAMMRNTIISHCNINV